MFLGKFVSEIVVEELGLILFRRHVEDEEDEDED